ncbi:hypothetical protein ACFV6F_31410 [Kitasatospora phosalacinea]|uniref:hypothetical protein n=1 Tax=Kitasatospora phosalacinea TaxID=2065 RepID=UPI003656B534
MGGELPTTAWLRAELGRAERVVVTDPDPSGVDGPGAARLELAGEQITELADLLGLVDGSAREICRCPGSPTITLYGADGEPFAKWGLHQDWIRADGGFDVGLRDGRAFADWLAGRGLPGLRATLLQQEEADRRFEQRRQRWLAAAPERVAAAAVEAAREPGGPEGRGEAGDRMTALVREQWPDGAERIRALLAWFAVGAGAETGGLWRCDLVVQGQLLLEQPESVLAALAVRPPERAHLDGAVELFWAAEWAGPRVGALPEPLRSLLFGHIEAHGTEWMRRRADRVLRGGDD